MFLGLGRGLLFYKTLIFSPRWFGDGIIIFDFFLFFDCVLKMGFSMDMSICVERLLLTFQHLRGLIEYIICVYKFLILISKGIIIKSKEFIQIV